jgi:hypothetical protein
MSVGGIYMVSYGVIPGWGAALLGASAHTMIFETRSSAAACRTCLATIPLEHAAFEIIACKIRIRHSRSRTATQQSRAQST